MPTADDLPEYPRKSRENAYRPFGDEGGLVVVPPRSEIKVLNSVASLIYSLMDGQHSRGQIVARIADEFDIDSTQAAADLDGFLRELAAEGLLESGSGVQENS